MPWNSPNGDNKDPWSSKRSNDGPPDLDELLRKLHRRLRGMQGSSKHGPSGIVTLGSLLLILILAVWFIAGFFIVPPAENAVVLRFGKYHDTVSPGLHWIPAIIERRYSVNVEKISTFTYQAEMLTADENIVSVQIAVQYRAANIRDYLFNVVHPQGSLQQSTASALRQVIANLDLDDILTAGGAQQAALSKQIAEQLRMILAKYKTGLIITDVTLQSARPPEAVTDAFDDAIMAREDAQRFINKAIAYQEGVEPVARGKEARLKQQAEAYKERVVNQAKGETARYLALLSVYQTAPQVTRERLYLSMLESVLSKNMKILVDTKGNNNVLYLPLDRVSPVKRDSSSAQAADVNTNVTATFNRDAPVSGAIQHDRLTTGNRDNYQGRGVS